MFHVWHGLFWKWTSLCKFCRYLSVKEKKKLIKKFEVKKLLVRFLFYIGQEKILHDRRVTKENYARYQEQLTKDIELIQNFKTS